MSIVGISLLAGLGCGVLLAILIPLLGEIAGKVLATAAGAWLVVAVIVSITLGIFGFSNVLMIILVSPIMGVGWVFLTYTLLLETYGTLIRSEAGTGPIRRTDTYSLDSTAQENRNLVLMWGAIVVCLVTAGGIALEPIESNSPTKQELAEAQAEVLSAGTAIHDGRNPNNDRYPNGVWGVLRSAVKVRVYREAAVDGIVYRFIKFEEDATLDDLSENKGKQLRRLPAEALMATPKLPTKNAIVPAKTSNGSMNGRQ